MARIVLIDDDPALSSALSLSFEDAGHAVRCATDGQAGWDLIANESPELVVTDINMPRLDGLALCKRLRAAGKTVPIILLTSRDNEIDESLGLELGADDYVTKPFSTRVLLARMEALLRRDRARQGSAAGHQDLTVGRLALSPERLEVRYAGTSVPVTVTEFRLLEALVRKPGIVFSREQLLQQTRGDDSIVVDRIIDTYVRRLRRKLETVDPAFSELETVIGIGYRWRSGA